VKILLTGRTGQVGSALLPLLAPLGELTATDRGALDLSHPESLRGKLAAQRPDLIVNAAAYTNVDRAESEPDASFRVNAESVGVLAEAAARSGALLVHFSTDYVFDGAKGSPYKEEDPTGPLNAYGRGKLAGERAIAASGCRHLIFRTSWVYGPAGRNFVRSILAAARAGRDLRVVNDQRGAPTCSLDIAAAVAQLLGRADLARLPSGLYHLSAAGETTWHGFAVTLLQAFGLANPVAAIPSAEYRTAARRPACSLLDCARARDALGIALPDWRAQFAAVRPAIL
jgi:dTDP-4-dehydrorhamnose reductase